MIASPVMPRPPRRSGPRAAPERTVTRGVDRAEQKADHPVRPMPAFAATDRLRMPQRPRRHATLTDVAKLCGVTPATVSRVLNGKAEFSASDAVRARIAEAAAKLGYVPDLSARNLNRRETHIVGLFASPQTHVAEGITEQLLEGVADVLHDRNYDVFFELAAERRAALPFWRFDGAILLQGPRAETVEQLDHRRVPYVCVNEGGGRPVARVLADDAGGMRQAAEHLAGLGHRRVAYANARGSYIQHYSVGERHAALLEAATSLGIELTPDHDRPFVDATTFLDSAVVRGGATAVIAYDHNIAVTLVGAAPAAGLTIPGDFSLICFNDVFPIALLPTPLTAVAVSGREMGRLGAERLVSELAGRNAGASETIRVPEALVVRASTAPPKNASARSRH